MNELYFLGIDVAEEVQKFSDITTITCTNGMTDSELSAYKLGVINTIAAMKAVLQNDDMAIINIEGLDVPTELSIYEVETYCKSQY